MKFKIFFFLLTLLSSEISSEKNNENTFKILVYNTHGLPEIFIEDNPKFRFPIIGNKTQEYNISLIQEDYAHHKELESGLGEESILIRGPQGRRFSCLICTGSGLTSIFNISKNIRIEVENEAFKTCSGWFRGANDCFAFKGFQVIKLIFPNNKELFILNTHMDAGRRDSDRLARKEQLAQISKAVKEKVKDRPLIVAGDLNLYSKSPEDMKLLENFKNDLNLTDSFKAIEIGQEWPILDYILYRNTSKNEIKILNLGEDTSFKSSEGPLSDHPALFIEISFEFEV